jgi:hypothetical protein
MRTDGRTDMSKLIVAFRNFANAHTKVRVSMTEHLLFTALPQTS